MMRTNSRCSSMRLVVRSAVGRPSTVPAEYVGGRRPPRAPLQPPRRPRREQAVTHHIEIGEREERKGPRRVLCQPAVAHLGKAPQPLHDVEGMLTPHPDARARPIDRLPPRAQRVLRRLTPLHTEAHLTPPERVAPPRGPVRPIPLHRSL